RCSPASAYWAGRCWQPRTGTTLSKAVVLPSTKLHSVCCASAPPPAHRLREFPSCICWLRRWRCRWPTPHRACGFSLRFPRTRAGLLRPSDPNRSIRTSARLTRVTVCRCDGYGAIRRGQWFRGSVMNTRISPVAVAARALLGISVSGFAAAAEDATPVELATVYVYATAINEDPQKIASSFSVLEGEALFEKTRATLGETLNGLPGVHADTFGGGAARPVIRGQTAPRVTVLSDSAGLLAASDISPDHAVTAEPMLVERIEILRGPATLLYGSGAIGGVVNLLDAKVPTAMPVDGLEGRVAMRGGSAARERALAAGVTARAASNLALRLEGTARRSEDYRARGLDEPRVDGSWAHSGSATAGASWIHDYGYVGMAYTLRDDDYGVPGHSHEYESCHPHGGSLHCGEHEPEEGGEDHDHGEHAHEVTPQVALRSKRFDLRGEFRAPFALAERIR